MNGEIDIPSSGLVLDGGLATELEQRGHELGNDLLWSARLLRDDPDALRAVHQTYLDAGADIITTASYQATMQGFLEAGLEETEAIELIRNSVRLAKSQRDDWWSDPANRSDRRRPWVAASVGPYGAYLADGSEFRGEYGMDRDQLVTFHRQRWQILAAEQPDLMVCETVPCLIEARALVDLANETSDLPVWISFSCRDGSHINDGTPIKLCGEFLESQPRIQTIGVNCTAPQWISSLIGELRMVTQKPIVVYPNSGETWDSHSRAWSGDASSADFAELARQWHAAGAAVIGGCCRTTPEHIRAVRQTLAAEQR